MKTQKQPVSKEPTIADAIENIKKKFGNGAIIKLDSAKALKIGFIPTGIKELDEALGVKGIPRGRITEIFGKESTGKSTLALMIIAKCQEQGGVAAFIDVEHSFSPIWAHEFGVNTKELLISQPNSGEEALQIAEELMKSKIDLLIIDTVAALTPMKEIEGDIGVLQIAPIARLMSQALRKLNLLVLKANTAVVFLNQVRIDPMVRWGSKEKSPGGSALKFYASVRIRLQRIKTLVRGVKREPVGFRILASIVKNKVAQPFKRAEFEIHFDPKTQK